MISEDPEFTFAYFLGGYLAREQGEIEESLNWFKICTECSNECEELINLCRFELGWCQFTLNNFSEALPLLKEFNKNHKSNTFKAWSHFIMGICHANSNLEKAVEHFTKVKEFAWNEFSWDKFAVRKSKEITEGS